MWVLVAFLVSCLLLTAMSWLVLLDPALTLKPATPSGNLRQELHRPEPGVRAVRGDAGFSRHHAAARGQDLAGAAAGCDCGELRPQHGIRDRVATALVTIPVMVAIFAMIHLKWRTNFVLLSAASRSPPWRGWFRRSCRRPPRSSRGLPHLQGTEPADIDRAALESGRNRCGFSSRRRCSGMGPDRRADFSRRGDRARVLAQGHVIGNPHNQTLNVAVQWGASGLSFFMRCGFSICCCFAARAWWHGSASWSCCKIC